MTTTAKVIALFSLVFSFNLTGATQTASLQVRPEAAKSDDQIILPTTVTNKNGDLVTGLQRDNFEVFVDKKPAKIGDFRLDDVPISVGIVVDASGSIWRLSQDSQAWQSFLLMSNQANEYFVLAFNNQPQLLLDWTSDHKLIVNALALLQPKGNTAFYDACYLALDKVRQGRHSKRVLILITDGQDNLSTYSFDQVREELRSSDVQVYAVSASAAVPAGVMPSLEGEEILNEFSSISGGRFFYKRNGTILRTSDAMSVFETIAKELRHQYAIAVTTNGLSGENNWHKVKIKVVVTSNTPPKMKHLSARTRAGFYLNQR